ncbi:vWA domain-containing protein [Haladaptatus sp. NG-SE-30]
MHRSIPAILVAVMLVLAGCAGSGNLSGNDAARSSGSKLGYAVGGANDINNFRNNVEEEKLPLPSDVTHEGLFHDYYFDTGGDGQCSELFCPAYSTATLRDPLSNETERYMTVSLNSGISKKAFERKRLNLVVVLDVSGSMQSEFGRYYYDGGEKKTVAEEERTKKIEAATQALADLTTHLRGDDRLGVVVYNENARTVIDLQRVDEMNMEQVRGRIREIQADGSTNLEAGMDTASGMLEPYRTANPQEYENRVIYLTDAMPNTGDTSLVGFENDLEGQAADGIYSTFIGVGIDFNSELVNAITDVRGANYYAVHSNEQFAERMDSGFEYMVTPLVFDLSLAVDSDGYEIENVYGSPSADEATGELMSVNTLFPSQTKENRTKGGVVLVQLNRAAPASELTLTVSYEDRTGKQYENEKTVTFAERSPPHADNTAIRKAVLLAQYGDLMQNWIRYERAQLAGENVETPGDGVEPASTASDLGEWERRSTDLQVSPTYADRIDRFERHFESEMGVIGDDSLKRELAILQSLLEHESTGDE